MREKKVHKRIGRGRGGIRCGIDKQRRSLTLTSTRGCSKDVTHSTTTCLNCRRLLGVR